MPPAKIIIVTGANRGIGLALSKLILSRPTLGPIKLFAASRSGADLGLVAPDHNDDNTDQSVFYPRLDVTDKTSISALAEEVRRHGDQVNVLVNNAGVNLDSERKIGAVERARKTLDVNVWGTYEMCKAFLPLLAPPVNPAADSNGEERRTPKPKSRIVNISSVASTLKPYSSELQTRFRNPRNTLSDLQALAEEYLDAVHTSTEEQKGWGVKDRSYNISKALLNALTALLARENPDVMVNCCCPGWVATDMGRLVGSGKIIPPKTAEQGATIPLRLALDADVEGISGRYFANASVRDREGRGEVQEW